MTTNENLLLAAPEAEQKAEKPKRRGKGKPQVTEVKKQQKVEAKEVKRILTWQELTQARATAIDREGKEYQLTKETLNKALRKDGKTMAAKWNIRTLGYHMTAKGELVTAKDSHFYRVTGEKWSKVEPLLVQKNRGRVITVSGGSRKNHFIFLLPSEDIQIQAINHATGKPFEITKENFFKHFQVLSNHGRCYGIAKFLAYQFNLLYLSIPKGEYYYSNPSNLNFEEVEKGWAVRTEKANLRNLPEGMHPLDVIEDLANGGGLAVKLIKNQPLK